jgi:peptidoglycan hydrolase CwlO-like protein
MSTKPKKLNQALRKKDVYTIVLEDLRSQFKVFGESLDDVKRNLSAVRKTGDTTFEEVGDIKVEITAIKMRIDSIEKKLNRIENRPAEAQAEIESFKKESMEIKSCSNDEDIQERLNIFEARIGRIEKQLKLSVA